MKHRNFYLSVAVLTLGVFMLFSIITVHPVSAKPCIPEGAIIDSATFSIYVNGDSDQTVQLHRITASWTETGVTWGNFGGSFDGAVEGSFVANGTGWRSVDITSLVQQWTEGIYRNYGLLLEQGLTNSTTYRSSEDGPVELRPKLEICYTTVSESNCITIQRPGTEQDGVADAYIWEISPNHNGGNSHTLYTGNVGGYEKQRLVQFELEICPGEDAPGTGTPGYWKTHPEAWPVDVITIGDVTYAKDDAIAFMWMPEMGDKTFTIFRALVSAKLNVLIGNDDSCIAETIAAADEWMDAYGPVDSRVKGNSPAWQEGEPLYFELDDYNNGYLCAPSRDSLEE